MPGRGSSVHARHALETSGELADSSVRAFLPLGAFAGPGGTFATRRPRPYPAIFVLPARLNLTVSVQLLSLFASRLFYKGEVDLMTRWLSKAGMRWAMVVAVAAIPLFRSSTAGASIDTWGPWIECYPVSTHEWCASGSGPDTFGVYTTLLTRWGSVQVDSPLYRIRCRLSCDGPGTASDGWYASSWSRPGKDDAFCSCPQGFAASNFQVELSRQ
jgi:hypothetical protein